MIQTNRDTERKIVAILKVLSGSAEPLGSITIARELERQGINLGERAVRYHLKIMDERGFTVPFGRDGRSITPAGLEELRSALVPEQVGFVIDRIELLAYNTTFDPDKRSGRVAINTSLFDVAKFKKALAAMKEAVKAGYCVSHLMAVAQEGGKLGDVVVPPGKVGLATVCSATVNGVLLKAGIPMDSRFGGVLEMQNSKPRRFVAMINYSGSSLDPSEVYIRARMTRLREAVERGVGRVLANFREIPAPSKPAAEEIVRKLQEAGIGGALAIGEPSEPLCQIPVGLNKVGMILLGGLNPVAAAAEAGVPADNIAESGTIDFEQLTSVWEL